MGGKIGVTVDGHVVARDRLAVANVLGLLLMLRLVFLLGLKPELRAHSIVY